MEEIEYSYGFRCNPDKLTTLQNKIKTAITRADLILTIGGSSVGKYDLVKEAIKLEIPVV